VRLNKYQKDAFVSAVMQDVPQIDYREQKQAIVNEFALARMPEPVRAIAKNPAHAGWLATANHRTPGAWYSWGIEAYSDSDSISIKEQSPKAWGKLEAIAEEEKTQEERIKALRAKLEGVTAGCHTRKALAEALPEFEKYLPAAPGETCKTLPALANLVTDFIQAGWPKGQPKPEGKPAGKAKTKRGA